MNMKLFLARNKPDKLTELYLKSVDEGEKSEILSRLVQLGEIKELWAIFNLKKEGAVGKLLLEVEGKSVDILSEMFIKTEDQGLRTQITDDLMDLKKVDILWGFLDSHYDEYIWDKLFKFHSTDLSALMRLYESARTEALQRRVIDRLFELKAKDQLHEILFDLQSLGCVERFVHLIMEKPEDIAEFFRGNDSHLKSLLASALKNKRSELELIKLLKQIKDKHILALLREVHQEDHNLEIGSLGLDRIDELLFTSGNQSLGEFYRSWDWLLDAVYDISFEFFFTRCNDRQKLYLLLIRYGICKMLGETSVKEYHIDLSHYIHYTPDAESLGLKDLLALFDEAWHRVLVNRDKESVCLACLLSRKKVQQNKAKYAELDDPEDAERRLRHHYKNLKAKAKNEEELQILVMQEQEDLSQLINKDFYASLLENKGSFEPSFYDDTDFTAYIDPGQGSLIGLRTLNSNSILVDDLSTEISKAEVALQQQIFRLTDPAAITKAKQAAELQKAKFIGKDDLIHTISHINPSELPPQVLTYALEIALSLGEEASTKAVLYCISKSQDPKLLDLLTEDIYKSYLVSSIKAIGNKPSVNALRLLLSISKDLDLAVRLNGAVGFSPDGRYIATRSKGVFSTNTWEKVSDISLPEYFSPDGRFFVSWEDGVFSTRTWKKVADIKNSVCFSPDSRFLVTWNSVYSTKSWTRLAIVVHPVGFSKDSRYFASIDAVYETDKWTKQATIHNSVCFSTDGRWLATFNYVYSVGDWKQMSTISMPEFFSPDGNYLVCKDGIYSTQHWGKLASINGAVCFSPGGDFLITSESVYSTINWAKLKDLKPTRNTNSSARFFSRDGKYLAFESDLIRTADWSTAIENVQAVSFSPNCRLFATRNGVYAIGLLFEIKELILNNLVHFYQYPKQITEEEVLEALALAEAHEDFAPFVQPLQRLHEKVLGLKG
jgi:hypothetical protein